MKYLLMCQYKPQSLANAPTGAGQQIMQAMMEYNHQLIQSGVLLAAGQLAPPRPHSASTQNKAASRQKRAWRWRATRKSAAIT
jgi:hypothetical protein